MAEINTSDTGGKKHRKRSSTKIDMTPMVDLGFLLITFFMLATTLAKPVTMQLAMPDKTVSDIPVLIKESQSLTVILGKNNQVFYYQGLAHDPNMVMQKTNFSDNGIRKVLFDYKARIGHPFTVVIKSTENAKYRNMIDLLDELTITGNKRYAIVNTMTNEERQKINF